MKVKVRSNLLEKLPIHIKKNRLTKLKYSISKKMKKLYYNPTFSYPYGKSIKPKNLKKIKTIFPNASYYRSFMKKKIDKIEKNINNQFTILSINHNFTEIYYSTCSLINLKDNKLEKQFIITSKFVQFNKLQHMNFYMIPHDSNDFDLISYVSSLKGMKNFTSYFEFLYNKRNLVLLELSNEFINATKDDLSEPEIFLFSIPNDIIDKINFSILPEIHINKINYLKTNEVFMLCNNIPIYTHNELSEVEFEYHNKSISFGKVVELYENGYGVIDFNNSAVDGSLIYSIWNLNNPIGINIKYDNIFNSLFIFTCKKMKDFFEKILYI